MFNNKIKSFNTLLLALVVLATFLATTISATALFKPARAVSSVSPVPTVAFGGPTPELLACLKKKDCCNAARIYHHCMEELPNAKWNNDIINPAKNNTATFHCLCDTYHD
ncbi:hypothetical protein IFR04_015466, partial [Cadophora malorum]